MRGTSVLTLFNLIKFLETQDLISLRQRKREVGGRFGAQVKLGVISIKIEINIKFTKEKRPSGSRLLIGEVPGQILQEVSIGCFEIFELNEISFRMHQWFRYRLVSQENVLGYSIENQNRFWQYEEKSKQTKLEKLLILPLIQLLVPGSNMTAFSFWMTQEVWIRKLNP